MSMCRPDLIGSRRGFDMPWRVRPRLTMPEPPREVTRRDLWSSAAHLWQFWEMCMI